MAAFVPEPEAIQYLGRYGLPYPGHGLAGSAREAVELADELGYPVVLKVVSEDVVHKSEAGGVLVGLKSASEVEQGYGEILRKVGEKAAGASIQGVLVCQEAEEGLEIIVGGIKDQVFGPTVMFGLGGVFTEVLDDVAFRVAPLSRLDAAEMVEEIRGYPLLTGIRGGKPRDIQGLVQLLLTVSRLMTERPEIMELDLNPVRIYDQGLRILDVRMMREPGAGGSLK